MDYFSSYVKDGFTYSVDMIRLRSYISRTVFKDISKYLFSFNLTYWQGSGGYGKFFDNWKVDKLWIGFTDNRSKKREQRTWNDKINFTMEFNPNKLTSRDLEVLVPLLIHYDFTCIRFDMAVDIPKNINCLCLTNITKKSYSMFSKDYNDKTYYFGKGDGHIKIYNKKIEAGLDYELTRYEITKLCEFDIKSGVPIIDFHFIPIYFCPYYTLKDGSTYSVILFALENGFPFRALSRDYRDKIKKDYFGSPDISEAAANIALQNCVAKLIGLSNKPT